MAIFDRLSRYVRPPLAPYKAVDVRGREVVALPVPAAPNETAVARHALKEGQTLDQLSFSYLADANGYWRIAEVNDAILPDALADVDFVRIPKPSR